MKATKVKSLRDKNPKPIRGAVTSERVSANPATPVSMKIQTLLVPVDFSEEGVNALHYAAAFARQFNAAIRVVHVIEPSFYPEFGYVHMAVKSRKLENWVREKLKALAARPILAGLPKVSSTSRSGRASTEIVEEARDCAADLIIISTHGHTGLAHTLMGSTAEKVVRHAPCPVLVVKELEHDFI